MFGRLMDLIFGAAKTGAGVYLEEKGLTLGVLKAQIDQRIDDQVSDPEERSALKAALDELLGELAAQFPGVLKA